MSDKVDISPVAISAQMQVVRTGMCTMPYIELGRLIEVLSAELAAVREGLERLEFARAVLAKLSKGE